MAISSSLRRDAVKPLPISPEQSSEPQQLSIPLEAPKLGGLSREERDKAVGALAVLFLEAADTRVAENDDARV